MECILNAVDLIHNDNVKLIENDADKMTYFPSQQEKM